MDFIRFRQKRNKWQGEGVGRIDPYQIQYIESVLDDIEICHCKLHLINGNIIECEDSPEEMENIIKKYFDEHEDPNKIILTRDDLIKNFLMNQIQNINNGRK